MPNTLAKHLVAAAVVTAALLHCTPARAGELSVKLTVEESSGVARKAEPAWGGVPLPAGAFKKDQKFTLSSGGAAVPAQVLPLVVDEKGFIRWVLVDTQVDMAAKGKKELVLSAGESSAKPQMAVKVVESADAVTVDTGRVKFSVSKSKPFCLFDSVEAGGKVLVNGGAVSYTDGFDGKKYKADKPQSVVVEYAGPMHATVCVKGRFTGDEKNAFQYVARFTAWAGLSRVHVKYSLCNSNPDHYCFRQVKDSSVVLALAEEPSGTIVGADAPKEMGASA
ncbi:MAG: exo-rhamnogalacturonan lyase family protein, partial [Planctomycetota bacterium]